MISTDEHFEKLNTEYVEILKSDKVR